MNGYCSTVSGTDRRLEDKVWILNLLFGPVLRTQYKTTVRSAGLKKMVLVGNRVAGWSRVWDLVGCESMNEERTH
jgi:hypothetical protein